MQVHRGLDGVVVSETKISAIVDNQLLFAGYNIDELVAKEILFEEVIYLLWYLQAPTMEELEKFKEDLYAQMPISDTIITCLKIQTHENLHPMSVLRSTISLLGVFDPDAEETSQEAVYRQSVSIQAKIPTIVAAYSRLRRGLDPISPKQDGTELAANFLYMLTGEEPEEMQIKGMNEALVLHADHDFNASTFTARVCSSTLSDVYSCITAAIGSLKGPLHGGANEKVFDMLTEIAAGDLSVEDHLDQKLDRKEKVMGFGHRVYKVEDPRKKHLKRLAQELTTATGRQQWYFLSCQIEQYLKYKKGLIPNVDFYSATVYHCLNIDSDLFTLLFAMSRVSGWLGHVSEQKIEDCLIRPRSLYVGETHRHYPVNSGIMRQGGMEA
ncbi:citrate synthase [Enterococcus sp. BWB1-3]|uniref:citrate/2-methylcitrate synthase n=1 Tax=unclassified Enterococcus TaxID=2608891 RepID=UPI0019208D44|nr:MULTISPECIES: citrate/2-methylcitrate synthase [unclassified Enterococcus]MBL1229479.1 citrate synthase [Enterococcus sp. BWB1-3]MCB5952653.1 citrate synthase [Enterococcus sp. BWT-B8]